MKSASDAKKADKPSTTTSKTGAEGEGNEEPKRRRFAGRTLVLFIIAPLLLVRQRALARISWA